MATIDTKIFDRLDTKHPDYLKWQAEWIRYRDVLGDELVDKEQYLPKCTFETQGDYNLRLKLSQFIPDSGLALERLVGALFNEKPKREFKGTSGKLQGFMENADRKRTSWNTMVEEVAWHLLGYGTTRTLINVPPAQIPAPKGTNPAIDPIVTRADEIEQKIHPFAINYTPLAVIAWDVDLEGNLLMVRIKEERTVYDSTDDKQPYKRGVRFIEYTQFTVEWWDFVEGKKADFVLRENDSRVHNLGVVPMITESLREIKPMIGHSFIRYGSRADIQKCQSESDQAYDTFNHAHPFLAIWTEDELKEVGLGSNTYLKLNPGSQGAGREDARYVDAPTAAYDALERQVKAKREAIDRHARLDPMAIASGGGSAVFQASGAARAWSFGTSEARTLSKIADKMEQIEIKIFDLVIRWQEPGELPTSEELLFQGSVQYPEEFDMASTSQLLEETGIVSSMINSPRLLRTLHKRIAASKVGDTTAKILQEIQDEIEDNPLINTAVGKSATSVFQMPGVGAPDGGAPVAPGGADDDGDDEEEEGGGRPQGAQNRQ